MDFLKVCITFRCYKFPLKARRLCTVRYKFGFFFGDSYLFVKQCEVWLREVWYTAKSVSVSPRSITINYYTVRSLTPPSVIQCKVCLSFLQSVMHCNVLTIREVWYRAKSDSGKSDTVRSVTPTSAILRVVWLSEMWYCAESVYVQCQYDTVRRLNPRSITLSRVNHFVLRKRNEL